MPLRPRFLRDARIVLIEGDGEISADDMATLLRFIDTQNAHRHRKLIDARRVTNAVSQIVADGLVRLVRSREALGAGGALAVVVGANASLRALAERAAAGAPARRSIRIFDDYQAARRWLEQSDAED